MAWLMTCLCLGGAIYCYRQDPRTIWLGIDLVLGIVCLALALNSYYPLAIMVVPSLLIVAILIYNMYDLLVRHQKNRVNIASLLILLIFILMVCLNSYKGQEGSGLLYGLILAASYFFLLFNAYLFTAIAAVYHRKTNKVDAIVVLGAGLRGRQVPSVLASRIKRGMQVLDQFPQAILIMSGGQGEGESVSEAQAMKIFATNKGADPERIYLEDKSTSTYENLAFTKRMLKPGSKLAIVTNHYHLLRALLIARDLGIECVGYGARTALFFSLRAFVREFAGYLYLRWRLHLGVVALLVGLGLLGVK